MIKTIKIAFFLFMTLSIFLGITGFLSASQVVQISTNDLGGTYEYSAFYEMGSRAGTQTDHHKVKINQVGGEYQLSWGSLNVVATRVAGGLIYKWKQGNSFGEGIYIFYENNRKLFGTFLLTDERGEQRGYTQGKRIE